MFTLDIQGLLDWLQAALMYTRPVYFLLASMSIMTAAFWVVFRFKVFRTLKPSLTLEITVEDQTISEGKRYVMALLKMTNTSRVRVDFGHSACSLHRLEQLGPDILSGLQRGVRGKKQSAAFGWPELDDANSLREKELSKGECIIEPQANEQQFYEFIVDDPGVMSILVKCYVYDRNANGKEGPSVWAVQKIHRLQGGLDG